MCGENCAHLRLLLVFEHSLLVVLPGSHPLSSSCWRANSIIMLSRRVVSIIALGEPRRPFLSNSDIGSELRCISSIRVWGAKKTGDVVDANLQTVLTS